MLPSHQGKDSSRSIVIGSEPQLEEKEFRSRSFIQQTEKFVTAVTTLPLKFTMTSPSLVLPQQPVNFSRSTSQKFLFYFKMMKLITRLCRFTSCILMPIYALRTRPSRMSIFAYPLPN